MGFEKILFYVFSSVMILSALAVISFRHSVKAVLSLVLCFFAAAALWMMLEAEFLAVSLVLVYVGAVMVLFLFVVMMLDVDYAALKEGFTRYLPVGVLAILAFFAAMYVLIHSGIFSAQNVPIPAPHAADYSNIKELGLLMYTVYFYPFELAAVILLVAIIAAISLAFRGSRHRKVQINSEQIRTRKSDRLRIIKMEAEMVEETVNSSEEVSISDPANSDASNSKDGEGK